MRKILAYDKHEWLLSCTKVLYFNPFYPCVDSANTEELDIMGKKEKRRKRVKG